MFINIINVLSACCIACNHLEALQLPEVPPRSGTMDFGLRSQLDQILDFKVKSMVLLCHFKGTVLRALCVVFVSSWVFQKAMTKL